MYDLSSTSGIYWIGTRDSIVKRFGVLDRIHHVFLPSSCPKWQSDMVKTIVIPSAFYNNTIVEELGSF